MTEITDDELLEMKVCGVASQKNISIIAGDVIHLRQQNREQAAKIQRLVEAGDRAIDALMDEDNWGSHKRAILAWRKAKE